ncbi:hypothetical protein [Acidithiobacillus thiooxidans]|nr:hypothetical protein [Acidithiobacillus thiooxidans]
MNTLDHLCKFLVNSAWFPAYVLLFLLLVTAVVTYFTENSDDEDNR